MKPVEFTLDNRIPPRPKDLTAEKIESKMRFIYPGDVITFDSYKTCYTQDKANRYGSTVKATGTVVENHGGYLAVKLRGGLIEYVNYFGIESVNGVRFSGYSKLRR